MRRNNDEETNVQNGMTRSQELRELPEDPDAWWREWYLIDRKPNPIEHRTDKYGNVQVVWTGPKDAPGLLGYPFVKRVVETSQDGRTVLAEYLAPMDCIEGVQLAKVADSPETHCVVVVRKDAYKI